VGAGTWLLVYHAEYDDPAYFLLGLAVSSDKGLHWTDIGEIIRFNKPFGYHGQPAPGAIGDPPLVVSPDGKYFYVYFLDWLKSGKPTAATCSSASTPASADVGVAEVVGIFCESNCLCDCGSNQEQKSHKREGPNQKSRN
jgi:hypothetical protein